jgi:hypothetical protein
MRLKLRAILIILPIAVILAAFLLFAAPSNISAKAETVITIGNVIKNYNAVPANVYVTVTVGGEESHDYTVTYAPVTPEGEEPAEPTEEPPVNAGEYIVTVSTPEMEQTEILIIYKVEPIVSYVGQLIQPYGKYTPVFLHVAGIVEDDPTLEEVDIPLAVSGIAEDEVKPELGKYAYTASFEGSVNYLPYTVSGFIEIPKREIPVSLSDTWQYEYDGKEHTRTLQYTDFPEEDGRIEAKYNLIYDSGKDVGFYNITLTSTNYHYLVGGISGGLNMEILKRPLNISLVGASIAKGETPEFTFKYMGFAEGEDPSVLSSFPEVLNIPDTVGVHTLLPSPASAKNYLISYTAGSLIINDIALKTVVEGYDSIVRIKGVFTPDAVISVSPHPNKGTEAISYVNALKARSQIVFDSDLESAYKIDFTAGGQARSGGFDVIMTKVKISPFFRHTVGILSSDGRFYKISKYTYKDGVLSFTAYSDGMLVIYRNSMYTYVPIIVFAVIMVTVSALLIAVRLRLKRLKQEGLDRPQKKKSAVKKAEYDW